MSQIFSPNRWKGSKPDFSRSGLRKIFSKVESFRKSLVKAFQSLKKILIDHYNLVFKTPAENHLILTGQSNQIKSYSAKDLQKKLFKPQAFQAEQKPSLVFHSYSQLKKYQKKTRFAFSFGGFLVAFAVIMGVYFFTSTSSQGANYSFHQTNWAGGQTSNTAAHPDNTANWNEYESKDEEIEIANEGDDIRLVRKYIFSSETSDAQFNAGTKVNISTSGSGDGASLILTDPAANQQGTFESQNIDLSGKSDLSSFSFSPASQQQPPEGTYPWSNLANTPASVGTGSDSVAIGNHIYAFRGSNTPSFWRYAIDSNSWTALANIPVDMVRNGAALVYPGSGNHIYAFRGGYADFWRYSISGNSWTTLASAPNTMGDGADLIYPGSGDYFYALRGLGTNTFWRYSISGNSWSSMASVTDNISNGASMAYPGTGDYIYVLTGNSTTNFRRYSITDNSWSSMASILSSVGAGGSLVYPGSGDYLYATRGNNWAEFFRYSISGNKWDNLNLPYPTNAGGSLSYPGTGNYIYLLLGNSVSFNRYDFTSGFENLWNSKASIPASVTLGGSLVYTGGDYIYATRGTNNASFYRYSISGNSWTSMANVPASVSSGGSLVYAGGDYIYALRGNISVNFYRYSISGNSWTSMANTPITVHAGGSLVYPGSGDYLYAFSGNNTSNFYRYSISGNSWSSVANTPVTVFTGGKLVASDSENYLYAVFNNSNSYAFYRYSIADNLWEARANTPIMIRADSALAYPGDGDYIYFLNGTYSGRSFHFARYSLFEDSWSLLTYTPKFYSDGVSLVFDSNFKAYALYGNSGTDFYQYSVPEISVKFQVAANNDNATWNYVGPDGTPSSYFYSSGIEIPSSLDGSRYLKYKAYFKTSNANLSPVIDDVTISYSQYQNGTLTSSKYNTGSSDNILHKIQWTENIPSGTDIKFQVRSSPDGNTWTDFVGPDGTSMTYFADQGGNEDMPTLVSDNANDQWIQYKAHLITDGLHTPTFYDTYLTYVVNDTPEIQNVYAVQNSDGTVTIDFEVRDPDTSTGITANSVVAGLEYCSFDCDNPGSETWTASSILYNKSVEGTEWTRHQLIWDPKADYDGQYHSSYKIRITADDREMANNIGRGESNDFVLDTKNPILPSFSLDHTQNKIVINSPLDDSDYYVYIGNSVLSLFNVENKTNLTQDSDYPNQYIYGNFTLDPATVYVGIKDAKGNTSYQAKTTPAKPNNLVYYDVSDTINENYREFLAWDVISLLQAGSGFSAYKIYRSEDNQNFSQIAEINDRNLNYYMDQNLFGETRYFYKVHAEDIEGNKSTFSTTVDDVPDGQGGSDSTPPTISNVNVSDITTTSAKITWITDELSDSSVGYSEEEEYLPERGLASMVLNHEIILTNLKPGTTYNIRVKSRDLIGNLAQNDKNAPGSTQIENFSFQTLPGPAISQVNVTEIHNNQATIEWKTSIDANSYVVYFPDDENSEEFGFPYIYTKNHKVTLTNYNDLPLNPNTRYYFYVKSIDQNGNEAIDNNGGMFYELLTTEDNNPPQIQDLSEAIISHEGAAITWITDEPADSLVEYGTKSGQYSQTQEILLYDRSHFVILPSLEADKKYYYKVTSKDINGNESQSEERSFTTNKSPEFQHDPLSSITFSEKNPSILTDKVAVISFTTDQAAKCFIEYKTSSQVEFSLSTSLESRHNQNHAIHIPDLVFSTEYAYRVTCSDNLETVITSEEQKFTTQEKQYSESGIGELLDRIAPQIGNISVSDITGESAVINWNTNEAANSLAAYVLEGSDFSKIAGDYNVVSSPERYKVSHSVKVSDLIPDTKYLFSVISSDASGNVSKSEQLSFTTRQATGLSSVKIVSTSLGQANVSWRTSDETTSEVEYGLTTAYGETKQNSNRTREHSLTLTDLEQGKTYHLRVKGKDSQGNLYASSDMTFEPKSPPKIDSFEVSDITENTAKIKFNTNVPTDSLVTYTDPGNDNNSGFQGRPDFKTKHEIIVKNLASGTKFSVKIKVRDEDGNETEEVFEGFTTTIDENPPKIEQVRTDTALAQNDKVQAIISWKTDENADTAIIYKEGRAGKETEVRISDVMTTSHIAVITTFKPGTVYYFNAKSTDQAGNVSKSNDFALLTPKRKENIIQIIVNNFQEIFGWARM